MTDTSKAHERQVSPRIVNCPSCAGDSFYASSNPYRPFCSERCKLNDLGDWASDRYRLAGEETPGEDEH